MTDIAERLHTIRAHLQTGAVGQREVWEEWLTEAVAEIEALKDQVFTCRELRKYDRIEIERLTAKAEKWQRIATEITAIEHARRLDNERLTKITESDARKIAELRAEIELVSK